MINFEIKRIFHSNEWLYFCLCYISLHLLTFFVVRVLGTSLALDNHYLIDNYNAISQLSPYIFAPLTGNFFSKDYESNAISFYKSYRISLYSYTFNRVFSYSLLCIFAVFICGSPLFLLPQLPAEDVIKMNIIISLNFIYYILICSSIAVLTKKGMTCTLMIMAITTALSLVNVAAAPLCNGWVFLLDSNSGLARLISLHFSSHAIPFINIIISQLASILLVFFIHFIIIKIWRKRIYA